MTAEKLRLPTNKEIKRLSGRKFLPVTEPNQIVLAWNSDGWLEIGVEWHGFRVCLNPAEQRALVRKILSAAKPKHTKKGKVVR